MKKTILQKTVEAIDFPRMRCSDFWEVCPYRIDELKTKSRKQQLTVWRNLGMFFYSHHYQSVVAGSAVFNRDHATCFHGLNRLMALNITDTLQLEAVEKIRKHIKEKINVTAQDQAGNSSKTLLPAVIIFLMNIGLVDIDGHNFPNLALMKISAYHKSIGDNVSWVDIGNYDRTYMSKVFTFSPDYSQGFANYGEIIKGGTGFKMTNTLPSEIDKLCPDYSIYPKFTAAYGFLTRGCPNKCSWCVVPSKEGNIQPYADIEEFLQGRKEAVLMDNNVLAHEHGLQQIEKIIRLGIKVDFNQGLDARIIAKDKNIAELLSKVKWSRYLRMACDTKSQIPYIEKALANLNEYGFKNYRVFVYVLVKEIPDALDRVMFLKEKGCSPFAQPYRDFETNKKPNNEQKKFSRWVNHKAIFKTIQFSEYR